MPDKPVALSSTQFHHLYRMGPEWKSTHAPGPSLNVLERKGLIEVRYVRTVLREARLTPAGLARKEARNG